jgi:isovaleryl-CoA dehydrogenase
MSFAQIYSPEQQALVATARRFANEILVPRAYELDRDERFPEEAWERGAELGFLGINAPVEHGGAGLGLVDACLVGEELAAGCVATAVTLFHQANMIVDSIVRNGTEEQRARLLPGLSDGSVIGCLAITEPEAGSDALSLRTRAVPVEGGWRLTGTKMFITNGPVADLALVYAKTGQADSHEMALFIIDTGSEGFARGRKLEKMGWRASPTGELILDEVFVPNENVLGGVGNGLRVLMSGLNSERIIMAALAVGLARASFDAAKQHAAVRRQFGRRIGEFQLVREKLADMYVEIESARALTLKAAAMVDGGRNVGDMRVLASSVKLLTAGVAMRATTQAVQVLGGYGYTKDYPVERYMRDAKLFEIGGGTSEVLRNLIGKQLVDA